jgi:Mn-dependent DtxR family transcriptional regulator
MTDASRYLLAVHIAAQDRPEPIAPSHVADVLDKAPATTTEALQRLDDRGLVTYEPYEGASLTDEGADVAADLYASYTVLLPFFRDVLDIADAEREAMTVAGALDPNVADRLAATLLEDEPNHATARADDASTADLT